MQIQAPTERLTGGLYSVSWAAGCNPHPHGRRTGIIAVVNLPAPRPTLLSRGVDRAGDSPICDPVATRIRANQTAMPQSASAACPKSARLNGMFVLPPTTEVVALLYRLVGTGEQHRRNGETKRLCRFRVDH